MVIMSLANALKALFVLLGCLMVITLLYTISVDGLPFRRDLLTPWMAATLVDFYINVVPLAAWVCYKESNWVSAILWVVLLVCLGSITTCIYIFIQFLKLSPQESVQNPMYHVLLRHSSKYVQKTSGMAWNLKGSIPLLWQPESFLVFWVF